MKNFNRRSSHGDHGSKRRATRTLTSVDRMHSLILIYIKHSYKHVVTAPVQLMDNLESNFYFEDTRGIRKIWGRKYSVCKCMCKVGYTRAIAYNQAPH